jgi:hypothetical protein
MAIPKHFRLRPLAAATMLVLGSGVPVFAAVEVADTVGGASFPSTAIVANGVPTEQPRYIVRFAEAPLAQYNALPSNQHVAGIDAIPSKVYESGRQRLDVKSAQAVAYLNYLHQQQQQHLSDIATALGQAPRVLRTLRHALNAAVLELTPDQAQKIKALPGVVAVERDVYHPLATDIGPGFIGAASVWWGAPAGQDSLFASGFDSNGGFLGDGMVIGDIDTGYNSQSPSFAATDAMGYTITNPLGNGVYIGHCSVPNISLAGCNSKVIGVYDEINLTPTSVEDTQGHGSHTASTAAGNFRSATLSGYTATIAGVAPHANLVIYYACGSNGCPTTATTASVDQAIQDGIVDALNYSIGGGSDPWNSSTSQAFLSAADAGIFIAAAAGNTSSSVPTPVPGSVNHWEPWVTTVAAANHTGGSIGFLLTVNGTGAPGPIPLTPAVSGTGLSAAVSNEPIVPSPTYGNPGDGCSSFASGTFTGSIALLKYSASCGTNTMASKAIAAGADYVLIVANTDGPFLSGASQPKPVWTTGQTIGNSLKTYLSNNSGTTGNISYPAQRLPSQADVLANFSLLGPAGIDVIKPDVQAPGVNILAAVANDGSSNGPNLVALYNGTSMATPHTTGSGVLLMQAHPGWTPAEVKSALMMTAKEAGLTKPNGTTPSDAFDRGAGRLQDYLASKAGLVMNETGLNYSLANPAPPTNGNPSALNEPSMQSSSCITVTSTSTSTTSCAFTRKYHSTQDHSVTWTPSVTGVTATVSPTSLVVGANANSQPLTITVDASSYNSDGLFHTGELVLTPSDPLLTPLHLPIAVRVPPPAIAVAPTALDISIPSTQTQASATLTVSNLGGPTLNVTNTNDTTSMNGKSVVIDQVSQGNYGFYSDYFPDYMHGFYAADDFQVYVPGTNLSKLSFPGFMTGSTPLSGFTGKKIHFQIFSDASGVPNGNPESGVPVYNFVATIGSTPGLSVAGNTISIDLNAAGAPPTNLNPGRHWMVVWPEINYSSAWAWFESVSTFGYNAHNIDPGNLLGNGTAWEDNTTGGDFPGMAMHIEAVVTCGASWLTTTPSTLGLGGKLSGTVTVTASNLPGTGTPRTVSAWLCIDSNDANTPVLAVPVTATQN